MNVANMRAAIEIMQQAKKLETLNMCTWQSGAFNPRGIVGSIDELHRCGNTACFAGHVAMSKQWMEYDDNEYHYGIDVHDGSPFMIAIDDESGLETLNGEAAIAHWLDIDVESANGLVFGMKQLGPSALMYDHDRHSEYYDKKWSEVTADDVIIKLKEIMNDNYGK